MWRNEGGCHEKYRHCGGSCISPRWMPGGPVPAQTGASAPVAPPQPHKLTAAELQAMFAAPHTTYSPGSYGPNTNVGYYADGQIKFRNSEINDSGTYTISDKGQLCTKYRTFRGGSENCQDIYQVGPDTYEAHLPNGTIIKGARNVPGNPEGL